MGKPIVEAATHDPGYQRQALWVFCAAAALIFFQAYMVAPLLPRLSEVFEVPEQKIGLIVPAYMIAYGLSTLFYGVISDWIGRTRVINFSMFAFVLLTGLTATAQSPDQMIIWRLLTGLGASGVVPVSLAMIGDLYPFERRGKPLGMLFAAMEGGMAAGSTAGVMLEPFVGWRMLFLGTAVLAAAAVLYQVTILKKPATSPKKTRPPVKKVLAGFKSLLSTKKGARTYSYVFWNGIFHSGIYTWLGLYFTQMYALSQVGIGLAILGYGVPGLLLGAVIGRAADKWGRFWLIILGLALTGVATAVMAFDIPVLVAALAVTAISLGYDLTQPLFAGIVTQLGGKERGGQAMGLNVFALFTGFGLGSFFFGETLRLGFDTALYIFAGIQLIATLAAIPLFRKEMPKKQEN